MLVDNQLEIIMMHLHLMQLEQMLPFKRVQDMHEQECNNTVALVFFANRMPDTIGSVAKQVKRHEDLAEIAR